MGRKRIGSGKYFYICAASVIFLLAFGCTTLENIKKRHSANEHLSRSQKLLLQKDYESSLKENQRALSLSGGNPPGDQAIFNIALIHAHYENPNKDYRKSLDFFKKLITEYPQSPLIEQAKIWVSVLDVLDKSETKISELMAANEHLSRSHKLLVQKDYESSLKENQRALSLSGGNPPGDQAIFNIALIYAHYENPNKDYRKSLDFFKKLIMEYPQSPLIEQAKIWVSVLDVLERTKQVDIEIEKKKKLTQ